MAFSSLLSLEDILLSARINSLSNSTYFQTLLLKDCP